MIFARKRSAERAADPAFPGRLPADLPAVVPAALDDEEPRRRLSLLRLLVALCVLGGAGYGAFVGLRAKIQATTAKRATSWFAPYVDVSLTPTYQFQLPADDPARQSVLGFVVAASSSSCEPSWGGAYSLSQADQALALASRIAQLQRDGDDVIASFGGRDHTSLDVACSSSKDLAAAYQKVIDTYRLHTIDLDIEGGALGDFAAEQHRAAAIRILEQNAEKAHERLQVWLTLPVEASGLQGSGLSVVSEMLHQRVRIAGVNVMAMDFSSPPGDGQTMLDLVTQSLTATHGQLSRLLPRYGIHLRSAAIWQRMGVTVMLGQNNVPGERFTVEDAAGLRRFVSANGIARVSMWSINRDARCGAGYGLFVLSNICSGTPQKRLAFTKVFAHLGGSVSPAGARLRSTLRAATPDTNPANAPFPEWNPSSAYVAGYKVVENGEIYQAKWYNAAQDPSAQYQYSWQSPWELLGPVLPSDHAPKLSAPPPGTYPEWSPTTNYVAGQRVLYDGLAYQAKWSNQGVEPGIAAVQQPSSPWTPLYKIPGEPTSPSA